MPVHHHDDIMAGVPERLEVSNSELSAQLRTARQVANRLGLYDASDLIRALLLGVGDQETGPHDASHEAIVRSIPKAEFQSQQVTNDQADTLQAVLERVGLHAASTRLQELRNPRPVLSGGR